MSTFEERLKADPLNRASQAPLCSPTRATSALATISEPPPGYRRPGKWDQLWIYRDEPGRILLATHRGWEGIDSLILIDTTRRVRDLDELGNPIWDSVRHRYKTRVIPWEAVKPGMVIFHGAEMRGVRLTSLRIPGHGGRERRHG